MAVVIFGADHCILQGADRSGFAGELKGFFFCVSLLDVAAVR